jgi:cytoplasmic tRNA 2-thiolation protein 2
LKKELVTFSSLTSPPLTDLITYQNASSKISASSKSTTIDDLMAQYFESMEGSFPSIVANVVRTSSKLNAQIPGDTDACGFCGLPVVKGTDGIHGWAGDQSSSALPAQLENKDRLILCYGCSRSIDR